MQRGLLVQVPVIEIELTIQEGSADKKLAQGNVPPLLLKNACFRGPQTAFAFLKLYKLRRPWRVMPPSWLHIGFNGASKQSNYPKTRNQVPYKAI